VFKNRVLRKKLGPKREEVTGKWTKLHNEKLNDMNSSPSIVRVIKLKKIGPKREEVTGKWTKLRNEKLNDMNSPNIVQVIKIEKKNEMGRACSTYGGEAGHIQGSGGET